MRGREAIDLCTLRFLTPLRLVVIPLIGLCRGSLGDNAMEREETARILRQVVVPMLFHGRQ